LIDLYTKKAASRSDKDIWIRKQALSVIIYEGILANIFNYDYAPSSTLVENKRVWCNISQEGQSDVEFLREEEFINALLLTSKSYKPGICYQISDKGKDLLQFVPKEEKHIVDRLAYKEGTTELLQPYWDGNSYWMQSTSGFRRKSTITDTEAISYVSSAYIPLCLRYGGRPTMSNAHKAHSSGFGAIDTIRDKGLDEVITLNSVSLIVAEYIPFGSNQIVQLNNTIGSNERVQGGYISSVLDERSSETTVEMTSELTSVDILDYTPTNHINFEAEIRYPEDPGVVQIETFGISLNAEGTCFYGMQVEAVMDKVKDKISLDHLSRILVDVQRDSSKIVDSMISQRQRDLLDEIFCGDTANRNKINLIIANEISPHMTAEEYMDKGEYENELKQIIGDTKAAYDISERDTLVFGANGLLLCGPYARSHEPLLCAYLQFVTLDIFLQNYFGRLWVLKEDLEKTENIVSCIGTDPTALYRARQNICIIAKQIIRLDEILAYVTEALQIMEIPPQPQEQAGRSLYERLEIFSMRSQLLRRSTDLKKNILGTRRSLKLLQHQVALASDAKIEELNVATEQNLKVLMAIKSCQEESISALRIFQIIFSGTITFSLLDRMTGDWTASIDPGLTNNLLIVFRKNVILWLLVSLLAWTIVAIIFSKSCTDMTWYRSGNSQLTMFMEEKIYSQKLRSLLVTKCNVIEERIDKDGRQILVVTYQESNPKLWGGFVPSVSLDLDELNQYLLKITISYNIRKAKKNEALTFEDLKQRVLSELLLHGIFYQKQASSISVSANKSYL
jgi:WD repeat-containing protein 35